MKPLSPFEQSINDLHAKGLIPKHEFDFLKEGAPNFNEDTKKFVLEKLTGTFHEIDTTAMLAGAGPAECWQPRCIDGVTVRPPVTFDSILWAPQSGGIPAV